MARRKNIDNRREFVKMNMLFLTIPQMAEETGYHVATIERDIQYLLKYEKLKSKHEQRFMLFKDLSNKGYNKSQIAKEMNISTKTAEWYATKQKKSYN